MTKIAAVSLVASTLSLGFVVVAHAAEASDVTSSSQTVTSDSVNLTTPGTGSSVSESSGGSQSVTVSGQTTTPAQTTGSSVLAPSGQFMNSISGATTDSSKVANSNGSDTSLGTSTNSPVSAPAAADLITASGTQVSSSLVQTSQTGAAAVSSDIVPKVEAQFAAQSTQPIWQSPTISHEGDGIIPSAPIAAQPAAKAPTAPAKNLPIQGALLGISSVLATTTLPSQFHPVSPAGLTGLFLVMTLVISLGLMVWLAAMATGRFVDRLRASGYAHAARADVADLLIFATPRKVSFVWAQAPSHKLTFLVSETKTLNPIL